MRFLLKVAMVLALLAGPLAAADIALGMKREVFGHSVKNRPLVAWQQGVMNPQFKVLVVGSIHGDEPQGMRVVAQLRKRLAARGGPAGVAFWTVKTMNPDGMVARTRQNARRVDLNRNFPFRWDGRLNGGYNSGPRPASEPETRAMMKLNRREKFDLAIWFHQPWGRTLIPCNRDGKWARLYARLSRLSGGRGCDRGYYPGSATSWQYNRFGSTAFVVEFGSGKQTRAVIKRHSAAIVRLAKKMKKP